MMTNHEYFFSTPESCSEILKNGSPLFLEMYGDFFKYCGGVVAGSEWADKLVEFLNAERAEQ